MDPRNHPRDNALAASEMLPLLVEQVQEHALLLLDAEGTIVGWCAGAENIFGYSADKMLGQPVARLFTPDDVELRMHEHELRAAREHGKAEADRWHVRQDGTRIWVTGAVDALWNEQGEHVGFSKILRDRTELKSHIETLERRVAALADSDQRKNVFIGTMAHELGNAFASLRMTVEQALADRLERQDTHQLLANLQQQLEATQPLLDDLKDVTRIEAGQVRLEKKRIILNDVLERASATCQPFAQRRRQHFELLLPPAFVVVNADRARLHAVFGNLINNALKYTPDEGRIRVRMTTEGREAVVQIEDNGVGISPQTLPCLFKLFTQEPSTREQSQGGLGIGLWLVKNLVTLHGGTVSAKSEGKNRGSTFAVRLPYENVVPMEDEPPRGDAAPAEDAFP